MVAEEREIVMWSRARWPHSVTWPKHLPMYRSSVHIDADAHKADPISHIPSTALRFLLVFQYNNGNTEDLLASQGGICSGVHLP